MKIYMYPLKRSKITKYYKLTKTRRNDVALYAGYYKTDSEVLAES